MIRTILLVVFLLPLFLFSQDLVMPKGGGVYMVTKTGKTGFTPLGKLRKKAYKIANKYAEDKNTTAEIISVVETPQSFMIFPSVELTFRLVSESKVVADPSNNSIHISKSSDAYGRTTSGEIIINNKDKEDNEKYEKLLKLGKLFESGILTKEEFDAEKKKILGDD